MFAILAVSKFAQGFSRKIRGESQVGMDQSGASSTFQVRTQEARRAYHHVERCVPSSVAGAWV